MQQMLLVILVGYVCVRCLACGVEGQVRECADDGPGCLDVELRLQFERRQPRARHSFERPELSPWLDEPWEHGRRREQRAPAASQYQARKRPRNLQLALQASRSRFQ